MLIQCKDMNTVWQTIQENFGKEMILCYNGNLLGVINEIRVKYGGFSFQIIFDDVRIFNVDQVKINQENINIII